MTHPPRERAMLGSLWHDTRGSALEHGLVVVVVGVLGVIGFSQIGGAYGAAVETGTPAAEAMAAPAADPLGVAAAGGGSGGEGGGAMVTVAVQMASGEGGMGDADGSMLPPGTLADPPKPKDNCTGWGCVGAFAKGFGKGFVGGVVGTVKGVAYMVNPYNWDDMADAFIFMVQNPGAAFEALKNEGAEILNKIMSGDPEAMGEAFGELTSMLVTSMSGGALMGGATTALLTKFPKLAAAASHIPGLRKFAEFASGPGMTPGKFAANVLPASKDIAVTGTKALVDVVTHPVETARALATTAVDAAKNVPDALAHPVETVKSIFAAPSSGVPDLDPTAAGPPGETDAPHDAPLTDVHPPPLHTRDTLDAAMTDAEDWLMERNWNDLSPPRAVDLFPEGDGAVGRPENLHGNRPGWTDVDSHGSPGSVSAGDGTSLTGVELHERLLANGYRGGPVRVLACNAGTCPVNGSSVIQELADSTGYPVIGANDLVGVGEDVGVMHRVGPGPEDFEAVTENAWSLALPNRPAAELELVDPSGRLTAPEIARVRESRPRLAGEPHRGAEAGISDADLGDKIRGADSAVLTAPADATDADLMTAASTTARELRPGGYVVVRGADLGNTGDALHAAGLTDIKRVSIGEGEYAVLATKPTTRGLRQDDWISPEEFEAMDPEMVMQYSDAPPVSEIWIAPNRTSDPSLVNNALLDPRLRELNTPGLDAVAFDPPASTAVRSGDLGFETRSTADLYANVPTGSRGTAGDSMGGHFQISTAEGLTARNAPSVISGRSYSGHALDRMQGQGITPTVVEHAIDFGETVVGKEAGTFAHFDHQNRLTVITNASGGVVTVDYGLIRQ